MRTFFDSSAFAKRYIAEKGSQEVDDTCQEASALALSVLCVPEIISALNRRVREGSLTSRQYAAAKARLAVDVADAEVINLIPAVIGRAISLLETNALRALDALQIACALEWGAELFATCDERQIGAARKAGLRTKWIEVE
jgi:predicted nucleic acid-binding protein